MSKLYQMHLARSTTFFPTISLTPGYLDIRIQAMRFFAILLGCALLFSCQSNTTPQASPKQWVSMNQGLPSHAPVLSLALTRSGTVYAAAYNRAGVYKSNGGGGGWTPDNRGLPETPAFSLLLNRDTLWAGTAAGLYRLEVGAQTWLRADLVPPVAVYEVTLNAAGTLFAATAAGGTYSSADGGKNWRRVPGLDNQIILSVLGSEAQTIFAGTSGHGLFVTHNSGSTWETIPEFQDAYVPLLTADPRDSRTIYAGTRHTLMRSRDGGASWERVVGGIEAEVVYALLFDAQSNRIYAGTAAHGILASDDRGASWQPVTEPPRQGEPTRSPVPQGHAVLAFASLGDSIFAGTDDGVVRSTDSGRSWSPFDSFGNDSPGTAKIHDLALNPGDGSIYAATEDGLYVGDDGAWKRLGIGTLDLPVLAVALAPNDPRTVYVGTSHRGVFVSDDGGATWSAAQGDLGGRASVAGLAVDPQIPQQVFARVLFERIYKSTDGGDNWHTIWTGMPEDTEVETIAIDQTDPVRMYAGANDRVFYSTNGGESWLWRGVEGVTTFVLWIDPRDPRKLLAGTTDGLYRSEDGGSTWMRAGLTQMTVTALAPDAKGNLYAGTKYNGLFVSGDDGRTFLRLGSGLDGESVIAVEVDDGRGIIYAATSGGMYRTKVR
jgi:photosystem II stability/assembly factor-like uncharacterized protein